MKANLLLSVAAGAIFLAGNCLADPSAQNASPDQPGHVSPAPNTANDTLSTVKDAAGVALGAATAEVTTTSQGFVTAAIIGDMYEIEASKIASERSRNPKIRSFAQDMIAAHTATADKLKSILPTSGTDVTVPAHLDDRRQGMIDELRGAKTADFNGRYVSQQVDAHREALVLMNTYAKGGDVTALKNFALQTAPTVQQHLSTAQQLYVMVSAK